MNYLQFKLPMGTTEVGSMDELREHMTAQILEYIDNGLLEYWLQSIHNPDISQAITSISRADDVERLIKIGNLFNLDISDEVAAKSLENRTMAIHQIAEEMDTGKIEKEIQELESQIQKQRKAIESKVKRKISKDRSFKNTLEVLQHRIKIIAIMSKNEFSAHDAKKIDLLIHEMQSSNIEQDQAFTQAIIQALRNPDEPYQDTLDRFPELQFGATE